MSFPFNEKPLSAVEAKEITKICRDSYKRDIFYLRQSVDNSIYQAACVGHYGVNVNLRKFINISEDKSDEPYWDTVISGLTDSLHEDGYDLCLTDPKPYGLRSTSPDYKWTIMW